MIQSNQKVSIIAHRGANKIAPENTLKAFQKAIELGADYVEFDVHLSKDDEVIIMHDVNTFRTTGHSSIIKDMTLSELKELDAGDGEKIPTLDELIQIAKGRIDLQLEIKAKGMAEAVVKRLRKAGLIETTVISSFYHDELLKVQEIEPNIKLGALIFGIRKNKTIREAVDNRFYSIHPFYKFINEKFVSKAYENDIKVNAWTVDSKSDMRKLLDIGVDGIITNDIETAIFLKNNK